MNRRSVLLDIDGTIVARDGAISPALIATLGGMRERGWTVGCATARTRPAARIRLGELGWMADDGVFQNGALVFAEGRQAHASEMPAAIVAAAVAAAQAADPRVVIAIHHAHLAPAFSAALDDRLLALWGFTAAQVRPFAEGRAAAAIKVGMWMPGEAAFSIGAVHAAVAAAVGAQATVFCADEERFVFLTAAGVDKAAGARAWFAHTGRDPAQAIAAGDDRTDAPLLALCGHGITIAGGHPEAQRVAAVVVPAPPHDGLAYELARHAP